jgi:hypothetical protein
LEFVWVERVDEALAVALGEPVGSIDESAEKPKPPKTSKNGRAEKEAVLAASKS